jgi:carbon-monoxide dehydrogenase large subunit
MTDTAQSTPYVGRSLRRREDMKFLTGNGRYVDDIKLPGMLYLTILRSPHAHALITGVDLSAARTAAGVRLALAGADLSGKIGNIKPNWVVPGTVVPDRPVMAVNRVRFVGECVALVVAETREAAHDALELIDVVYETLPAVVDEESAIGDGVPQLHENVPKNITTHFKIGGGDYGAAARRADHLLRLRLVNNRLIPTCLETRTIVAEPSFDGRLTIYLPSQVPHMHRRWIAKQWAFRSICCGWLRRTSVAASGRRCTSIPRSLSAPIWPASCNLRSSGGNRGPRVIRPPLTAGRIRK